MYIYIYIIYILYTYIYIYPQVLPSWKLLKFSILQPLWEHRNSKLVTPASSQFEPPGVFRMDTAYQGSMIHVPAGNLTSLWY